MIAKLFTILNLAIMVLTEETKSTIAPKIKTTVSEGVTSMGFKVVYGDEDLTFINQVVAEDEKKNKERVKLNEAMAPLPPQDVKCLMSVDRYCSKEMVELKSVLIQAVKEDCAKCSVKDKERAGRVIASLMAHDPTAWRLFLTRSTLQVKKEKGRPPLKELKLRTIGTGEEVVRSPGNMYALPGVKVRVRRYAAELIP